MRKIYQWLDFYFLSIWRCVISPMFDREIRRRWKREMSYKSEDFQEEQK